MLSPSRTSPARDDYLILVVEDDPLQRNEVQRCLMDAGFTTSEAGDGLQALESIKELQPNIVIMDIKMPGLDGVGVVKAISEIDSAHLPKIILMTGDPDSLYQANQMKIRAFAVIEKPVPLRVLLRFVESAYDSWRNS